MAWTNIGDMSPKDGALVVRDAALDDGDFRVEAVETISETNVGGDESVTLLRQGEIFLQERDFASALETVGATIKDGVISRPNHQGELDSFPVDSDEGLRELTHAAHAHSGIAEPEVTSLVRIGFPTPYDQDPKFDGEMTFYPEGTSLWAVMRLELEGFDYVAPDESGQEKAVPYETNWGPFAGMPRSLETRADLCQISAFRQLERDDAGNPIVYSDGFYDTPIEWIGPKEPDLIALWESLDDRDAPELSNAEEPGF